MKNKGKLKTAEALRTAFWHLYSENDIDKIKISDITDTAGYNRGVFYSYYKNIYEIFDVIEKDVMLHIKEISCLMQSYIMSDFDNKYLSEIIEIYNKNEKYLRVLFTKDDNPRFKVRMKKMLIDNLLKEYKKNSDKNMEEQIDYYIEFYTSGMLSMLVSWCVSSQRLTVEQFACVIKDVVYTAPANILKQVHGKK